MPLLLLPTQKPRSGVRRGAPAEPRRVSQNPESESDGTRQVHMVPDQIQDPRSGVTEVSRPGAPKVQDPDSGRRPVALPQSDAQKPESRVRRAPQGGPGERGQPAGSRVRPPEARPRQQREGRDPGSKVRLSGEGAARGRIQRGREGEPGDSGVQLKVLMKTLRKQALDSVWPERRISHHSPTNYKRRRCMHPRCGRRSHASRATCSLDGPRCPRGVT